MQSKDGMCFFDKVTKERTPSYASDWAKSFKAV